MKTALPALAAAAALLPAALLPASTNLAVVVPDGAWTWFNDPRALFHNGRLYVGYVRANDGRTALTCYDPRTGVATLLWTSTRAQCDDHNNPGLLALGDGRLLAIYARHGTDASFTYRLSLSTNPVAPADWAAERTWSSPARVTYSNPHQLSAEGGRSYNFLRNLNLNPTFTTSDASATNWSAPRLLIHTGTGATRPYVNYASDGARRIDLLYTDGHPNNAANSLYHLYYEAGALRRTDGSLLKLLSDAPLLHDRGERGTVIYAYSVAPSADPNERIPTGRAWCWGLARQSNSAPVCVFSVQRDQGLGTNWSDARIYYYYARWTGAHWQKRFIAHAGRPLYSREMDYAGGIALDPGDPNTVFISSNAAEPLDLTTTTNVPLRPGQRYEILQGVTTNGGLSFAWTPITANSTGDNLRPYVARGARGRRAVLWFAGDYTAYTQFNTAIVGRLE